MNHENNNNGGVIAASNFIIWVIIAAVISVSSTILLPSNIDDCSTNNTCIINGNVNYNDNHIWSDVNVGINMNSNNNDGTIVGRAIAKVINGKENDFENWIINEKELVNHARNYNGNIYYYFIRDNQQNLSYNNIKYTQYEFLESWENVNAVLKWINDYPVSVFQNENIKNMLINGTLEYPSPLGYTPLYNSSDNINCVISNTLDVLSTWNYGNGNVGLRVNNSYDDIVHSIAQRIPLPCNIIWKLFDNYLEIQSLNPKHSNTKHHSGPHNDIGEIIEFIEIGALKDLHVLEELIIKDNVNYIWQIKTPNNGNELFSKYYFTLKLYNESDINCNSCVLLMDMEYKLHYNITNDVNNTKDKVIHAAQENLHHYKKLVYDLALNKYGTNLTASGIDNMPIQC